MALISHTKLILQLMILFLLGILAAPALYPAEAVIEGPSEVRPGQFAVFDTTDSSVADGGSSFWIFDPDLPEDWQSSECNGVLSTAFEEPGKSYYLHFVCYDEEGHSVATKKVTVKGTSPTPPTDPPPGNDGDLSALKEVSDKGVKALGDTITATRLAAAIKDTFTVTEIKKKIDEVLLTRAPEQRKYDWLTLWRRPVNNEIDKLDNPNYEQIIPVLVKSLTTTPTVVKPATITVAPKPRLDVYTGNNCPACKAWMARELPKFQGWDINFYQGTGIIPSFVYKGKKYTGYTSYETFLQQ